MRNFLVNNRPTLVSMIPARTREHALKLIKQSIDEGADALGIQINLLNPEERNCYEELIRAAGNLPVYITCYRTPNGMSDDEIAETLLKSAKSGGTLIDVMGDIFNRSKDELSLDGESTEKQKRLIEKIHSENAQVLMSSHTQRFMTEEEVTFAIKEQFSRGADIAKLVSVASSQEEQLENFKTSASLKKMTDKPFLFLCGGEYSIAHRRIAPLISGGPFLCTPEYNGASTPFQPLISEAKKILEANERIFSR